MKMREMVLTLSAAAMLTAVAQGEVYELMTGVDAGKYPGVGRPVFGSAPFPGTFQDGDRLGGTSDVGADATWEGNGAPMFSPNQFGALSFLYRRGSINFGQGDVPLMGVEFLGGPRLDLDGDGGNGQRSVEAVPNGSGGFVEPTTIGGPASFIDLSVDMDAGTVGLNNFDATGTNAGGANLSEDFGVTVNHLAGTPGSFAGTTATPGAAINPTTDDRTGALTAETGTSGTLDGVYRVDGLGYEIWNDSISGNTSTPQVGTFQFLGEFRGFVVERDATTGLFPTMSGEGLGTTLWPEVAAASVGDVVNSATGPGTATIGDGPSGDPFNGEGEALSDFGGDIGGYLDFLASIADPQADQIVFLESAGFGVNNSGDPVFGDTVSYDAVVVAQRLIPEPSSAALAAAVLGGLVLRRRGERRS